MHNLFKAHISSKRCPSLPLRPITYIPNFPSQKSDVKPSKKAQVMRTWIPAPNDPPQHARWEVVECASTQRSFAREPHDIVKELRRMASFATHERVCPLSLCVFSSTQN